MGYGFVLNPRLQGANTSYSSRNLNRSTVSVAVTSMKSSRVVTFYRFKGCRTRFPRSASSYVTLSMTRLFFVLMKINTDLGSP